MPPPHAKEGLTPPPVQQSMVASGPCSKWLFSLSRSLRTNYGRVHIRQVINIKPYGKLRDRNNCEINSQKGPCQKSKLSEKVGRIWESVVEFRENYHVWIFFA